MAIPESQLTTWSSQGSVTQSSNTYATIKSALENSGAPYASRNFVSFLQGSYGNDTNIYADSDVDIVMRLDSIFYHDLDSLPESQKAEFHKAFGKSSYQLSDFKGEVTAWLSTKFGESVVPGSKAIFVKGSGSRRDSDVLPAAQFRRYTSFGTYPAYVEGICFFLPDGTRIANFPKQHSENCTSKHQSTAQWFKPMVRILKNMRNRMIQNGVITDDIAPPYYLEGLLYNVPNDKFGGSYSNSFTAGVNWIMAAQRSEFVCANRQYYLLRENSHVSWSTTKCDQFLNALVEFWNHW